MALIRCVNLQVAGRHGVYAEEKERHTLFTVNVELDVPSADDAATSDDLNATVDYALIARLVKRVFEGPSRDLLETLAVEVLNNIGESFPEVRAATVSIRKPQPPEFEIILDGFEVELTKIFH